MVTYLRALQWKGVKGPSFLPCVVVLGTLYVSLGIEVIKTPLPPFQHLPIICGEKRASGVPSFIPDFILGFLFTTDASEECGVNFRGGVIRKTLPADDGQPSDPGHGACGERRHRGPERLGGLSMKQKKGFENEELCPSK